MWQKNEVSHVIIITNVSESYFKYWIRYLLKRGLTAEGDISGGYAGHVRFAV
jgi:hypothetical protein